MRNNRIIMTFGENPEVFCHMPRGFKESLRVKSIDAANKAFGKRDNGSLSSAVYKDRFGKETVIRKYVEPKKDKA